MIIIMLIRQEADAHRQIMSNAADLDMRENTGLGEQTRQQIKSVVAEYGRLPPKAYLQKLAHILSKK